MAERAPHGARSKFIRAFLKKSPTADFPEVLAAWKAAGNDEKDFSYSNFRRTKEANPKKTTPRPPAPAPVAVAQTAPAPASKAVRTAEFNSLFDKVETRIDGIMALTFNVTEYAEVNKQVRKLRRALYNMLS